MSLSEHANLGLRFITDFTATALECVLEECQALSVLFTNHHTSNDTVIVSVHANVGLRFIINITVTALEC